MTTITIDGKNYDPDTLSEEAKSQRTSLQFVDAVLQTARIAYSKALQQALPVLTVGDTMKFN